MLYTYLKVGQQLCHIHYMNIIKANRHQKSELNIPMETDKTNKEITIYGKYINDFILFYNVF